MEVESKLQPGIRIRTADGGPESWDLNGELSRMSLISVVQFFELGRQTGVLVVTGADGKTSTCVLLDGAFVDASHRHLRGREAIIALLGLKAGKFAFGNREILAKEVERIGVSPMIMDAVRLEDELERLSAFLPPDTTRLVLRNPHEVPTDALECGADTVMAAIAARPRTTIAQLEELVPLAPAKVRLAAAWLSSTGRLRTKLSSGGFSAIRMAPASDWYGRLLQRYPNGLRVLLMISPDQGVHSVISAITDLAKELDSGPAWMSVSPSGSAVARVRPRGGALLSIACLPMRTDHDDSLQRLVNTADLVLVCAAGQNAVADSWRGMIPARVSTLDLEGDVSGGCLVAALRSFSESVAPAPPGDAP